MLGCVFARGEPMAPRIQARARELNQYGGWRVTLH